MQPATLVVGHFNEGSSWTTLAERYVLALSTQRQVYCKSIVVNGGCDVGDNIKQFFVEKPAEIDSVIHIVLPNCIEYVGGVPNIAICVKEVFSSKFDGSEQILSLMDAVIGPCTYEEKVNDNQYFIPCPLEPINYTIPTPQIEDTTYKYRFYAIGEFNKRKRIGALLRAYHTNFSVNDNTALIVKTWKMGSSPDSTLEEFAKFNDSIINSLRIRAREDYQNIIVLTDRLNRDQILGLHKYGNCFISTSNGESLCLPMLDALQFNSDIICPDIPGPRDYLSQDNLVPTMSDMCIGAEEYIPHLHSGYDQWNIINIPSLIQKMKDPPKGKTDLDLDMNSVGQKLEEVIHVTRTSK